MPVLTERPENATLLDRVVDAGQVVVVGEAAGELGARQIVLGTSDHNHGINGELHVKNNSVLGIIDGHCYWQHPRFSAGGFR